MTAGAVGTVQTGPARRPTLGIVAVVIATQCVTTLLQLPSLLLVSVLHASEAVLFTVLYFLTIGAGFVALVLGLLAMIRGRGPWWGAAAVLIAVLGNVSVLELMRSLLGAR
jgi:energy-converting hydrogenase Eha subunit H